MFSYIVSHDHQRAAQRRQRDIGRQLKRLYADTVTAPQPECFQRLLEKADLRQTA